MGGSGGGGDTYPPNPNHIIQYAPYVENWHGNYFLPNMWSMWINAVGGNPYGTGMTPYNPDVELDAMLAALNAYCNVLLNFHNDSLDINVVATAFDEAVEAYNFVPRTTFTGHLAALATSIDAQLLTTEEIDESVNQYSEQLQADIEDKALPQFEAGMRDINAVMSSAFVVGEALIFAEKDRNVAKYAADLRLANWGDRNKALVNASSSMTEMDYKMLSVKIQLAEMTGKFWIQGTEYKRQMTDKLIDVLRMKIVAKKEQNDEQLRRYVEYIKWPLATSQYYAAAIGAAGGGHAVPQGEGGTGSGGSITSVLGGVMAGASIGALFNSETGGWGSAIGGAMGGAAALLA
jgi:hypothetical protein